MKINFTKMHGIGNDYVYVNCMEKELENPGEISIAVSPRHFSVGSDGLIMICHSDVADAKMRMFNAVKERCAETAYAVSANIFMIRVL